MIVANVRMEFRRFVDAEYALQLVALLPDLPARSTLCYLDGVPSHGQATQASGRVHSNARKRALGNGRYGTQQDHETLVIQAGALFSALR
jgi:hypothetical protein